jgi:hypothetical protein
LGVEGIADEVHGHGAAAQHPPGETTVDGVRLVNLPITLPPLL